MTGASRLTGPTRLWFTGETLPPVEIAREIYAYLSDPADELEQFTDPIAYHGKRGRRYDPDTGSVTFARR